MRAHNVPIGVGQTRNLQLPHSAQVWLHASEVLLISDSQLSHFKLRMMIVMNQAIVVRGALNHELREIPTHTFQFSQLMGVILPCVVDMNPLQMWQL